MSQKVQQPCCWPQHSISKIHRFLAMHLSFFLCCDVPSSSRYGHEAFCFTSHVPCPQTLASNSTSHHTHNLEALTIIKCDWSANCDFAELAAKYKYPSGPIKFSLSSLACSPNIHTAHRHHHPSPGPISGMYSTSRSGPGRLQSKSITDSRDRRLSLSYRLGFGFKNERSEIWLYCPVV